MSVHVVDTESRQQFSLAEIQPVTLYQSEGLVALLLCLEPGQAVGPCVMSARVLYSVMAGSGFHRRIAVDEDPNFQRAAQAHHRHIALADCRKNEF